MKSIEERDIRKKNELNIKAGYWEWENTLIEITWSLKSSDTSSFPGTPPPKHGHAEVSQYLTAQYKSWKSEITAHKSV